MSNICEQEGCKEAASVKCYLPDTDFDEPPDYTYCCKHAKDEGFCMGCGQFCAGITSFDFIHPGWCDNCYDEISGNDDDEESWEHADDYWEDEDDKDPNDSRNI